MMGAMKMANLFITILNMSLTGAFVIAAICLVRFFLKKSPKIVSYCLWAAVGFRLLFPFSIEGAFSLIPFDAQLIPSDTAMQSMLYVGGGNPLQMWMAFGSYIWLAGAAVMLLYGLASFMVLKHRLKHAVNVEANIYETKIIKTPFVFGFLSPKIYLPAHLDSLERRYVLLHEQTHINRRDHIVKLVSFLILCLHWFNPLVWLAFLLMSADMEMSCDEHVLKELGGETETKKSYSHMLLSFAVARCVIGGSPLAFGSGDIGLRIKNALESKRQSRISFGMSMVLVAVLCIGFSINRVNIDASYYMSIGPTLYDTFITLCCN